MAEMDAQIGLTADATGVEAGVGRAKKSLASLGASATKMGQDVAGAGDKAGKAISSVGDGGEKSAKKIERDTKAMQSSIQRYIATLEAGSKDSRRYWETMADFKGLDKNALRPLLDQLDSVTAKTKETESAVNLLGGSFTALRAAAGVAIGSVVVQSATQAATALYEASVQAERLRIMLDFSSARGSAREIAYLRTITSELGLAFGSTATAYSQFQAAARGTALEGEKSRAVFESIAKASAVMGLSAEQSGGVLLALQQMISNGTVQAEELRGQLGERLPGAFQIAAKAMGVTTAELGKMLEQGQVVADDFLPKFAKALDESLGGAAEKAANRLDAATNKFNNAWERLKQNGGDSGISQFWAGQINILTDGMNDVSTSMEMARLSGSGFIGQMKAGAGAVAAFANPLNAFSYTAQDLGIKLRDAEKELDALKRAGAERSSNLMLREAFAHAQRLVDKYREAKAAQNALLGVETEKDPRDQSGFKPRGASYQDYSRQQADSEKALIDVRMRAAGVNKQYFADLKTYEDALRVGTISTGDYIKAVSELATTTWKSSTAGKDAEKSLKDGASEAKKAASEYQRLVDSIKTKIATEEQELSGGEKLTESQRLRVQFAQELQTSLKGLSAAKVAEYTADLDRLEVLERESTARKEFLEIAEQERQQRIKIAQAAEQSVANLITGNQQLREEIQLIGLSASEQMEVIRLREEAVLLVHEQHLAEMARAEDMTGTMTRERIALEQEIELRRERLELMNQKVKREAVVESNRALAQEWQRTADQINQSLTDALMRGFENGKDFAANMRDTVVNMFKSMVLRPIIRAIVMPVTGAIAGTLGFSGSAIAGQGGMGGMGGLGLLGSLATSPWGASALGWAGGMGGFGAGFAGAASEAAFGAGFVGPSVSAAGGSIGAGATFAQALPYFGLALGAIALLGGFDKSGTPHYGASATYDGGKVSGDEAAFLANRGISGRYSASAQSGVNAVAMGAGMSLDAMDRAFGGKGGYEVTTAYSDDSSDDPGFGSLRITRNGEKVVDWGDTRTSKWADKIFADGAEGAKMYADAVATDVRDAMLDIDLPSWARDLLTEIGDNVSMEQLSQVVQQIGVIKETFDTLGATLTGFADLTDEARKRILDASGSIDALAANAGTYYQNFYTDGERKEISKKQVRAQLDALGVDINLDDPEARAKYRALVESQLANIDKEGAPELYAALLKLSGAFAAVTASADDAAEATKRQAEEAARQAEQAARQAEQDRRSAYDAFRRAVERDREALQAQASSLGEAINGISSAVDLLKSNARDLYDEVGSTAQMAAARGMVYIEDALAGVRAGASVADYTGLSDAISAARGGIGSGAYQSEFERQRDTLVLAGQLSELGELGDMQLSVEERQLRAINEQLEYLDGLTARADELINGTVALTGTVESYFEQLLVLLKPAKENGGGGSGGSGGSGGGGGGYGPDVYGPPVTQADKDAAIRARFDGIDTSDPNAMRDARITAWLEHWTIDDIARAYDVNRDDLEKLFADHGIASFAVGINRVPGDMVARIHKDEAIIPAVYNPFNPGAQRFGVSDSALVEELRALRKEVAELRLISAVTASNTAQLPVMADQFDSVTEGGNAMRGDAGNVLEL